jgi:ankyrin repeat protein
VSGKAEVARALLSAGADPDATASGSGATPLHVAIAEGHLAVAEVGSLLLKGNVDVQQFSVDMLRCWQAAASGMLSNGQALLLSAALECGATPLHVAIAEGHLAVAEVGLWNSFTYKV